MQEERNGAVKEVRYEVVAVVRGGGHVTVGVDAPGPISAEDRGQVELVRAGLSVVEILGSVPRRMAA